MPTRPPIRLALLVAALLVLTAVTGLVDAVSYLRLGHVFVANMTGNVVFLGFTLDDRSGLSAVASAVAISGFLVGALSGGRLATHLEAQPRRWLTVAFGVQTALLAVGATLFGTGTVHEAGRSRLVLVAVLAVALGLQNATVRRLSVPDLTTTVLTLTLTGLAADSTLAGGTGAKPFRRLSSLFAMLGGAGVGALMLRLTTAGVLAAAAVLVSVAAGIFAFGPAPAQRATAEGT
jgi:uncharacterized membrane protein YoaK (UPF0700 family)